MKVLTSQSLWLLYNRLFFFFFSTFSIFFFFQVFKFAFIFIFLIFGVVFLYIFSFFFVSILNFTRQGYMLSLKGKTLLLREMVTMFRNKDVIHSGQYLFWCMIHVPLFCLFLYKKRHYFLTRTYIYIYNG